MHARNKNTQNMETIDRRIKPLCMIGELQTATEITLTQVRPRNEAKWRGKRRVQERWKMDTRSNEMKEKEKRWGRKGKRKSKEKDMVKGRGKKPKGKKVLGSGKEGQGRSKEQSVQRDRKTERGW